jgi:glycosyltransferase involved in cell wall biosynthesis
MSENASLAVLPALKARASSGGGFVLTRKFLSGIEEYARRWPGHVDVWIECTQTEDGNLDHVEVPPKGESYTLNWLPADASELAKVLRSSRLVLASLVDQHLRLSAICPGVGTPLVYVSEYSLRTRKQIVRAETRNPFLRFRRQHWTAGLECRIREALPHAAGIQCNGTPTYEAYRDLTPHPLLYFDTRVTESMLAPAEVTEARTAELLAGGSLRLAFTGRLAAMKGVDHLPRVASELQRHGVDFTMDICGAGDLEPRLRAMVDLQGLKARVRFRGVLDFESELMPFVARNVDLFVCCHRQGDPSCTYLETMSCATPIVGYDNEAFAGIVRTSGVGWMVPMDDPKRLAAGIAQLNRSRRDLALAARAARAFAAKHTFEQTMQSRVSHMVTCSEDAEARAAS